jgi:polyphenol oxidase
LFNIFLNLPEANASTSVDVPNFVGTVTVLAKSKQQRAHQHASTNAAFDITDALGAVAKGNKNLSVTLVPVAAGGAAPEASCALV